MLPEAKKKSSSGALLFMGGAVVFALISGILISSLLSQKYADEPLKRVVVAKRDIPAGQRMTPADLRIALWPQSSVPRGSYARMESLLKSKSVPLGPIVAGQAVLLSQISKPESGQGIVAKLKPGLRAMFVRTELNLARSRLVYPGARVDLYATIQRRSGSYGSDSFKTKLLVQNVTVLAVGSSIDPVTARPQRSSKKRATDSSSSGGDRRLGHVLTVAVTPEQAEQLILAEHRGKVRVVLRSPKDWETVSTPGVTPSELLGEQGEPAPVRRSPKSSVQPRRKPRRRPSRRRADTRPVIMRGHN